MTWIAQKARFLIKNQNGAINKLLERNDPNCYVFVSGDHLNSVTYVTLRMSHEK